MKKGSFMKKILAAVLGVAMLAGNTAYLMADNKDGAEEGTEVDKLEESAIQTTDQGIVLADYSEDQVTEHSFTANFFQYNMKEINAQAKENYKNNKKSYQGAMLFSTLGNESNVWNQNHYQGVYQGLAANELDSMGLIRLNYAAGQLFDGTSGVDGVEKAYYDVTFPMTYDENTGYYCYDSNQNSLTLSGDGSAAVLGDSNEGFWPFGQNTITFGMNYTTEFYTTQTGTMNNEENGEDMIFEFSGDDDVWVFVDGELVIDLGGVHPAEQASINFRTGDVTYSTGAPECKGTIYKSVMGENYNIYDNSTLSKSSILNAGKHTLQIFYLERGGSKSNCRIYFNLPQEPQQNLLQVTNAVSLTVDGKNVKDDTAFTYQMTLEGQAAGNVPYTYIDSSNKQSAAVTGAEGSFTLKDGETALFEQPSYGNYVVTQMGQSNYGSSYQSQSVDDLGSKSDSGDTQGANLDVPMKIEVNYDTVGNYRIDFKNEKALQHVISVNKTATLLNWDNRTYQISLYAKNDTDLEDERLNATGNIVDYVDARFELLKDDKTVAKAGDTVAGGTVGYDKDSKRYYITWKNQNLPAVTGSDNIVISNSWNQKFTVRAREGYLGGNSVDTNGSESRVDVGTTSYAFPMPKVNVKITTSLNDEESVIFLGETLSDYFTDEIKDAMLNGFDRVTDEDSQDVELNIAWMDANGTILAGDAIEQIRGTAPTTDTSYRVVVTITPKVEEDSDLAVAAAQSMKSDDTLYQACMKNAGDTSEKNVTATGTYQIKVVAGELTITKEFDAEYLNNIGYTQEEKDAVAAAQSEVFIVDKYAPEDVNCTGEIQETYRTVLTYDAESGSCEASVKLTGLSIGNYKVREDVAWSWKYLLEQTEDTYEQNDGILYIGKRDNNSYETTNHYFGEAGTASNQNGYAQVVFTNRLDQAKKWFSDTCHARNIFQ